MGVVFRGHRVRPPAKSGLEGRKPESARRKKDLKGPHTLPRQRTQRGSMGDGETVGAMWCGASKGKTAVDYSRGSAKLHLKERRSVPAQRRGGTEVCRDPRTEQTVAHWRTKASLPLWAVSQRPNYSPANAGRWGRCGDHPARMGNGRRCSSRVGKVFSPTRLTPYTSGSIAGCSTPNDRTMGTQWKPSIFKKISAAA